jgi:hypothetical protein
MPAGNDAQEKSFEEKRAIAELSIFGLDSRGAGRGNGACGLTIHRDFIDRG